MFLIPRKAWPALIKFAPEEFTKLRLQFDASEPSSEAHKHVYAELEKLVKAFKEWARPFLAQERQVELLTLCGREQVQRKVEDEYWTKRFVHIMNVDLTVTEYERLMRHLIQHTKRPVKEVQEALRALDKPWKYRD